MKKSLLLTTVIMLITVTILSAQAVDQTFNVSGTYTVPAGYNAIAKIEVWGAGGGGGTNSGNEKGGGGGGAYASSTVLLGPGNYTVTVGAGGTPGVDGGFSEFIGGTVQVRAAGGGSTNNSNGGDGGTVANSIGTTKFAGGDGGNGANAFGSDPGGGGGGSATAIANGGDGSNGSFFGVGGSGGTGQGNGGRGADGDGSPNAAAGIAPGGGGGGKGQNGSSQNGADGRVVITVTSSASLPVMFDNVRAYAKNSGVQVEWSNLTERDLKGYAVERSSDGRNFHDISIYMPISNQNDKADYTSFDASPAAGTNFYRIRASEIGGKIIYSKILRVDLSGAQSFGMYPNPVTGRQLTVSLTGMAQGSYNIRIINANGQDVYRKVIKNASSSTSEMIELPASVKAGIYSMLINGDTFTATRLFVVQ